MNWSGILDRVLMVLEDPSILYESKFFKAAVANQENRQRDFENAVTRMERRSDSQLIEIVKTQSGINHAAASYVLRSRGVTIKQSEEK